MVNTAIIISGQTRTFRHVIKNQWWYVLRHYADAHVFASVTDDEQAADLELLKKYFPPHKVTIERINQPDCLEKLGMSEADALQAANGAAMRISSPPQGVLRQLWHLHRAWEFFKAQPGSSEFNQIIRLRPDLHFHRFGKPRPIFAGDCLSAWWGGYGGINDRFAIMGDEAAEHYFGTWERVGTLLAEGCPMHPESLVAASLEVGGANSERTLQAEFSAVRPDGQLVWPDMQPYDTINFLNQC